MSNVAETQTEACKLIFRAKIVFSHKTSTVGYGFSVKEHGRQWQWKWCMFGNVTRTEVA